MMEWYSWISIIVVLALIVWLKSKYIWPKLFGKEKQEYDD